MEKEEGKAMGTLTPENVLWLFEEIDIAAAKTQPMDRVRYRWMVWDGVKTEVAISIALALGYQIKGGEG